MIGGLSISRYEKAVRSPLTAVFLAVVIAVIAVVLVAASAASAALPAWPSAEPYTTMPSNAKVTGLKSADLNSVACTSAGNCVAVGGYADTHGSWPLTNQAMVTTETAGIWSPATEVKLPGNALTKQPKNKNSPYAPFAVLSSVACTSQGNCVAGGYYITKAHSYLPLIATETNGVWAIAKTVTLPANKDTTADDLMSTLGSVACATQGNCVAVGEYSVVGPGIEEVAMVVKETNGIWGQAAAIKLPSDSLAPSLGVDSDLDTVTCSAVGYCVALGYYTNSVATTSSQGDTGVMVATEKGGTWAQATKLSPPTGSDGFDVAFRSVFCTSAGNCVAVGNYSDTHASYQADTITETNGLWAQAQALTLPPQTGTDHVSELQSVSCTSANNTCVAVGGYSNIVGNIVGSTATGYAMGASETNGTWSQASNLAIPSDASTTGFQFSYYNAVTCTGPGSCVAVGSYEDKNDSLVPMILSSSATPHTTVIKAIDNQRIAMTVTPPLTACLRPTAKLNVTLTSTKIVRSKAAKLTFGSARFYIDQGIKHSQTVTVKTPGGGTKKVTEVTYTANATAKHLPASVSLSLKGLKAGSHTLKIVVSYTKTETVHGQRRKVTVATTVESKFRIC